MLASPTFKFFYEDISDWRRPRPFLGSVVRMMAKAKTGQIIDSSWAKSPRLNGTRADVGARGMRSPAVRVSLWAETARERSDPPNSTWEITVPFLPANSSRCQYAHRPRCYWSAKHAVALRGSSICHEGTNEKDPLRSCKCETRPARRALMLAHSVAGFRCHCTSLDGKSRRNMSRARGSSSCPTYAVSVNGIRARILHRSCQLAHPSSLAGAQVGV